MHKSGVARWLWLIILATGVLLAWGRPAEATSDATALWPGRAVPDRLIVALEPHLTLSQVAPLAASGGGRVRRLLRTSAMMVVDLPPGSDLEAAAANYRAQPGVLFAVPDTFVYPQLIPNDPRYDQQYHLPLCRAEEAWNEATGTASTIIAIIDSGVDLDHPDLAGKIWTNPAEIPDNGLDDDENGYVDDVHGWNFFEDNNNVEPVPDPEGDNDIVSHGTLAAGIAAAVTNEGYGTAGIDWHAQVMSVKVFGSHSYSRGTVSSVVAAIDYATENGAQIINLSLGGGYSPAFTPPIERAYQAGIIVVCAGGNDIEQLGDSQATWRSPVCNDGPSPLQNNYVVGVGATDRNDRKASYSNWDASTPGHFIDLCAPGNAIYGPVFQDDSFPGFSDYFGTNTGTSFSCPIVAGLAGLILARYPGSTPDQVIERIRDGADNIDGINPGYAGQLGTGRVNLARSLGVISPPQPAHNLQAADTPGDEGGSITLTWLKSADDGGGANNVTRYVIRRRQGTEGSFSSISEAPPGTEEYVDDTTTDGEDYYYLVRTFADALFSDSEPVGPVQSRNDSPPPQVTTLSARDRPDDDGGAIELGWTYSPPADFAEFRLYRENYNFTNVSGRVPLAFMPNPSAEAYTDTTVTDGVDYYYALTAVDTEGNENKNVTAAGPVLSFPNQNITFNPGLQMLATPVIPVDEHPATLFGLSPAELVYARYDPSTGQYVEYTGEPLEAFLHLALGRGFWIYLPRQVTVVPEGQSAPAGDFPVSLAIGWQMLGNPFFAPVDFSACTVIHQSVTYDLPAAEAAGLVRSIAWIWDTNLLGYRMLNAGGSGSRLIAPWQGFWVKGLQQCTFNITRPTGPATVSSSGPQSSPEETGWRLQLTAQAGPYHDVDNYCGVAIRPQQVQSPPLPGQGVDLSFAPDAGGPSVALKLYPQDTETITQPLTVSWAGISGPIRLSWPLVNTLPTDRDFRLTDLATGQIVSLRNAPGYSFGAHQPTGQRQFSLSISPRRPGALTLTGVSAMATGRGAEIVFVLSQAASCDIKIMNIAGRRVRNVLTDAPRPAGDNMVLWDGRNQGGARVPSGRYLISLEVRDEQGNVVRILRDLLLNR